MRHPNNNTLSTALFTLFYAASALLLAGFALWNYLMGVYGQILLPALLALLLAGAMILRRATPDSRQLCAYLVLIGCYLMLALQLPLPEDELWLGLPPILTLLLLPLGPALLLNLTLAPAWLMLVSDTFPHWGNALHYLALTCLASLPCWLRQRRERLLQAIDPHDRQCDALSRQSLTKRLDAEVERARTMERPLTVLLIYLPQLEMADEQFGTGLLHTLLDRVCHTVRACCRHHDALGRHQTTLFWLLLPDTGEAGALIVRERLLGALNREVFAETGALQTRIRACCRHTGEDTMHFEQRLLSTGMKLKDALS